MIFIFPRSRFAIFNAANLFIGVDSGFAHVANAAGVRCIFLIGAYRGIEDYLPWRLREGDTVIRTEQQVYAVAVADVMAAVKSMQQDILSPKKTVQ